MKTCIHALFFMLIGVLAIATAAQAQDGLRVYGPAGPTPQWIEKAKSDADIIYSGSETMMTDFVLALAGRIDETEVRPLYLRPLSILVRPGNPKRMTGLKDILAQGVKVLVVNGAGQNGVWEDMAGRKGDINTVKSLRRNIAGYAKNSAEARQQWIAKPEIDAWLIWNIWQVANPGLADVVKIEPEYAIYRDTGVVLTTRGKTQDAARRFVDFLSSPEGAKIFRKWGWLA